ncbi:MAG: glycosyl hydrolase [Candidatus Bathyarchaeia archaeon]
MMKEREEEIENLLSSFRNPPPGHGVIHWWILSGDLSEKKISEEINQISDLGISSVLLAAGHGVNPRYLSDAWFNIIKLIVDRAREKGLLVWIADEGGYPSGFAGDTFNVKYPELRMKALLVSEKINVQGGQTLEMDLSENTVGAIAVNLSNETAMPLDISSGKIKWVAPEGSWQVWLIKHHFCTSPTRYVHHPQGAKDTTYSLCDYLNPKAISAFLHEVHEKYKAYIGSEFGKSVLGFFGDEPDYSIPGIPWTENIFEEFMKRKGYDVRPFIPFFFLKQIPEEAKRARADYWDVWSNIFSNVFFRLQFEWCEKNGIMYTVHLNHEDNMKILVRTEGDFFRCMRYTHVPAIDAIWRQIWMDKVADFPKLASSVAHIFGRRFVLSESFAVYGIGLSLEQAKWVIDHQLVRGVNLILTEIFSPKRFTFTNPQFIHFPALIKYVNRLSFLLSLGQPCAQIALYYPSRDLWMGNEDADRKVWRVAQQLLENQRDFDFVDEESLLTVLKIDNGGFRNLSGQTYRAVIIPQVSVLSRKLIERLKEFAESGGRVIFLGYKPFMVVGDSFMTAERSVDLSWAICLPDEDVTPHLLKILPEPDVLLDRFIPSVKYLHRRWFDVDIFFFFNEGAEKVRCKAIVSGSGSLQVWDAESGRNISLDGRPAGNGKVEFMLNLEPYETKLILIGPSLPKADAQEIPLEPLGTVLDLSDNWLIEINGEKRFSNLKCWSDLGYPTYSGAVLYRKEFYLPLERIPEGTRLFLECRNVRYSARVWLNGVYLGERAWKPFRWEITKALRLGINLLEIEVRNTPAAEFAGDLRKIEVLKHESSKRGDQMAVFLSYLQIFLKFDVEMVPSGLLPPVEIIAYGESGR